MSPPGRDRGPLAAVDGGPVNAAAQPALELRAPPALPPGRPRVSLVRSPAPGGASRRRSGLPGLRRGLIGLPGLGVRVPRGCRARAAGVDLLSRGVWSALPAGVRVAVRGLARGAEDGYQPRSQQDQDNRGHDEHRGKRHGRTRVRQEIPFLRRQAAGCWSRSPPGTGHRAAADHAVLAVLFCVVRQSRTGLLKGVASRRRLA
jgi:hypothetical protein